jgi:hypothetical protein
MLLPFNLSLLHSKLCNLSLLHSKLCNLSPLYTNHLVQWPTNHIMHLITFAQQAMQLFSFAQQALQLITFGAGATQSSCATYHFCSVSKHRMDWS